MDSCLPLVVKMPGSVCGLYIMRKDRLSSDKHANGEFFQLGGVMFNGE